MSYKRNKTVSSNQILSFNKPRLHTYWDIAESSFGDCIFTICVAIASTCMWDKRNKMMCIISTLPSNHIPNLIKLDCILCEILQIHFPHLFMLLMWPFFFNDWLHVHNNPVVLHAYVTNYPNGQVCTIILLFRFDLKLVVSIKNWNAMTMCPVFSRRRHSHNCRVEKASFVEPKCVCVC